MRIWNVSNFYYGNDKVSYIALPYSLKDVIASYRKHDVAVCLLEFIKNCRFTEKSAKKLVSRKIRLVKKEWDKAGSATSMKNPL